MLSVRLIAHASVVIDTGTARILTDPWFSGRAFNDSWELVAHAAPLNLDVIDYLWISHEHPDHFHIPTLRSLPKVFKSRVVVLFQQSCDHPKMVAALRKLGFANIEILPNRRWVRLSGAEVLCYPSRQMDSALAVRGEGETVLNVNDCELDATDLRDLRKLVGKPNFLLNQFSIAGFEGREDALPHQSAAILDAMVAAHRVLDAGATIPFASFARFCCRDNAFLNRYANTPRMAAQRFALEGMALEPLAPGQTTGEPGDALAFWDRAFAANPPAAVTNETTIAEIERAFIRRCALLKEAHGIWRHALRPVVIGTGKLGTLRLCFASGRITTTEAAPDVSIKPQPLWFMLAHDFGLQTLGVSGRYRLLKSGRNWLVHRVLFAMLNAGVGLSLRKLLSPAQLSFFWQRRNDLGRQLLHVTLLNHAPAFKTVKAITTASPSEPPLIFLSRTRQQSSAMLSTKTS